MGCMTEIEIRDRIAKGNGRGTRIDGLSNEEYHNGPGISSTGLKKILQHSVGYYLYEKANPTRPSDALVFGNAWHTYLLEPDTFDNRYASENDIPNAPSRNTTAGKNEFADWDAAHPGVANTYPGGKLSPDEWGDAWRRWRHPELACKQVLSLRQLDTLDKMKQTHANHPLVPSYLDGAWKEVSFFWIDAESGLLCKCRPDIYDAGLGALADPKTCDDASPEAFRKEILKWLYHLSAAYYLEGLYQCTGQRLSFVYLPSEKNAPFAHTHYRANEASIEAGQELYRAALRRFAAYQKEQEATGKAWEGLPVGLTDIDIPAYGYSLSAAYSWDSEGGI